MTRPEGLTERQLQMLRLVVAGHTNPQIAVQLYVSEDTVKTTVRNVYRKLGAANRAQAVARAVQLGLVQLDTGAAPHEPSPTCVTLPDIPGATPKQVSHWINAGWLQPRRISRGHTRVWPITEVEVARRMARLVAAGLTPEAAHRVARGGQLAPGITITIADEADVEDGAA